MTFTFTIDAFPGYTKFDKTQKIQFVLQVVDTASAGTHDYSDTTIQEHYEGKPWDSSMTNATTSLYPTDTVLPATEDSGDDDGEDTNG